MRSFVVATFLAALTGCTASTEPTPSSTEPSAVDAKATTGSVHEESRVLDPCTFTQPTYLLRLPDNDGAPYWSSYYGGQPDGYTVPFPTPWITDQYYADVHKYEELQWSVPSSEDREFLVKVVYTYTCVDPTTGGQATCFRGFADGEREWFMVPFYLWSDLAQAKQYAAQYASEPNIDSKIIECVRVVEGPQTAGAILTPVESDIFVDVHDPHNPPFSP